MAQDQNRYQKAMRAGNYYNEQSDYAKALSAFRIAIDEFPQQPAPYAGLGEACLGLKQLERALECFKLAAKYSRGDVDYLKRVADVQERQGQLSEAGRTYMAVGEILLRSRQLDEAVGNWQRAIRLDSSLLGAHKRLAMVFQRQGETKEAVREYLAIARILQMQGQNQKALQMCQAALRLDPNSEDVLTAVELIQKGAEAYEEEMETDEELEAAAPDISEEELAEADALTATVRQMAAAFEAERRDSTSTQPLRTDGPVETAQRLAQEQLAAEIFRDEDDEEDASLSKLERDALLGQGMDFEARGKLDEAISCYRRAIEGGLRLPAAYFVLGSLYTKTKNNDMAQQMLGVAAQDKRFQTAVAQLLQQ